MDAEEEYEAAESGTSDEIQQAAEGEERSGADLSDGPAKEEESAGESDDEEEYEEVDIEFDEDDIVSYLVDEDDNEIGFTLLDEDGNEVEYYYVEEDDEAEEEDGGADDADAEGAGSADEDDDNPYDLGITREGVAQTTSDMNAIYKDGMAVAAEFKGAFDDIKSAFDFTGMLKKK